MPSEILVWRITKGMAYLAMMRKQFAGTEQRHEPAMRAPHTTSGSLTWPVTVSVSLIFAHVSGSAAPQQGVSAKRDCIFEGRSNEALQQSGDLW
jgi:hypothetical protein